MTRVLRRPMFRIGGVAEGLTSGLDNPQLTASRPGYNRGRVVNPGGYKGDTPILDRTIEAYPKYSEALQGIRGERRPQWPQFLTGMGLDLLTRPKSGNIFQQVAASAKDPYAQMMATRSSRGEADDKLSAALFGDVMDIETRKFEAQKKVEAEEAGRTDKQFDPGQAAKIDELRKKSFQEKLDLENELGELQAIPELDRTPEQEKRIEIITKSALPAVQGTLDDLEGAQTTLEKIAQAGMEERFNDTIDRLVDEEGMTLEEAFQEALKIFTSLFTESKAEGGRIGYQNAGAVMPGQPMQASMPTNQAPGPTDQGQDSSVQNLSFEELRGRLPQEITNDIVKLLSESKQALVDFANIRTQQDVNAFNQKYDVNLVVPQEA